MRRAGAALLLTLLAAGCSRGGQATISGRPSSVPEVAVTTTTAPALQVEAVVPAAPVVESLPGPVAGDESACASACIGQGPTIPPNSVANGPLPGAPSDAWYRANTGSLPPAYVSACESGNDPANKRSPRYRGKWQFAWGTWVTMGGSGDPADASEAEQDYRASLLWADGDGAGAWGCY